MATLQSRKLESITTLIYPLPDSISRVGYTLATGVSVTLTELIGVAAVVGKAEPWDRNPIPWSRTFNWQPPGGTATTVAWTYTVPAGKMLYIARVSCTAHRWATNTAQGTPGIWIDINGLIQARVQLVSNLIGATISDLGSGGPLIAKAGDVVTCTYVNSDTGGYVNMGGTAAGFLYDP